MNERMITGSKITYPNVPEEQLSAQNVLNNLKNWDFQYLGQYKLDEKEAQKLIQVLEDYILMVRRTGLDG